MNTSCAARCRKIEGDRASFCRAVASGTPHSTRYNLRMACDKCHVLPEEYRQVTAAFTRVVEQLRATTKGTTQYQSALDESNIAQRACTAAGAGEALHQH